MVIVPLFFSRLTEHPPFDFIFIDADKLNNPRYLEWALTLSKPGTVVFADNIVREGAIVQKHTTDLRVHEVQAFVDMLANEPLVHTTAIQTVGRKGYDGFLLGIAQA
ncbi:O-methyltransferase [Aureibacillus halotolerans]|uniref:O-methyltransferase n=1 Tax=Aureibacillus halotolerans TaxID=1508390 RepID=UPI001FB85CC9|nr:hypothetical protein [Aureibacillus halotolerans]